MRYVITISVICRASFSQIWNAITIEKALNENISACSVLCFDTFLFLKNCNKKKIRKCVLNIEDNERKTWHKSAYREVGLNTGWYSNAPFSQTNIYLILYDQNLWSYLDFILICCIVMSEWKLRYVLEKVQRTR